MNGMKQCFEYDQRGNGHLGETDPTPGVASASGVKKRSGPCHSPLLSDGDQERTRAFSENPTRRVRFRDEQSIASAL